jgi:hypothetical protein
VGHHPSQQYHFLLADPLLNQRMEAREGRRQIKAPAEGIFEGQRQPREVKEGGAKRKVNEQVHVASVTLISARERPEEAGMQHAMLTEDCDDAIPVGRAELAR